MEDGCTSAKVQNRSCLCDWCDEQSPRIPWIDERTKRIEISFVVYNAQYGLYGMAGINFWFNRGGHIYKLIVVRSAWAGVLIRRPLDVAIMLLSDIVWFACVLWVCKGEVRDMIDLIKSSKKRWYHTLADDYLGFWNFVDWVSILIAFAIVVRFVMLLNVTAEVNTLLGDIVATAESNSKYEHLGKISVFYDKTDLFLTSRRTFDPGLLCTRSP
jgi:hypothetical protein